MATPVSRPDDRRRFGPVSESVAFDRAAEYYDRTRANPERAQARITELLAAELRDREPALEVGVGTGRIALPLHDVGITLAGADISPPMLRKLVEKAGGRPPFPLVLADAMALPFGDDSFGAVFACHVLHLIPEWTTALAEMRRVVRPGGVILIDAGGGGSSRGWSPMLQDRFALESGMKRLFFGANDGDEVDAAMGETGLRPRSLPTVIAAERARPDDAIKSMEAGEYSWTWALDERTRRRAGRATRAWARERYGDLTRPRTRRWRISWRAFDVPG